jgi:nicotinate-nucleotide--dimethylbenzimidazole phosphoribosyltransferase
MGETRYLIDDILEDKIKLEPVDAEAIARVKKEWDRVSKPINSFGKYEELH